MKRIFAGVISIAVWLALFALTVNKSLAADVFCSAMPISAPNPVDPLCSVISDRGFTGTVEEVLAALSSETGETCKRTQMSGYEIRAAVDETEYTGIDPVARSDFLVVTSGGEQLNPYGFGEIAVRQIFGTGPTLTALSTARVQSISINELYGLSPRAIDVQLCQGG